MNKEGFIKWFESNSKAGLVNDCKFGEYLHLSVCALAYCEKIELNGTLYWRLQNA